MNDAQTKDDEVERADIEDEETSLTFAGPNDAPPGSLAAIGIGVRRLTTLPDCRTEMQKVYKALAYAYITDKQASRLIWLLDTLRRAKVDEKKLALIEGGLGDMNAPFAGLTIVGGDKPERLIEGSAKHVLR